MKIDENITNTDQQAELSLTIEYESSYFKPCKSIENLDNEVVDELRVLEALLKYASRRGYTHCQILVLLDLGRHKKPMRICELSWEVNRHRQTVLRAVEEFYNNEVQIERPTKALSIVHLQRDGVDVLKDIVINKKHHENSN